MTREVVSVRPEATLKEVAQLLVDHRISGLPVCDESGRVVGVVSEGDILYRESEDPDRAGLLARLFDDKLRVEARKAAARTAEEAMTAPPITIGRDEHVSEAARRMVENGVNRLPVVGEGGRVVGIVTRADLVRVFSRSDQEIAREIEREVVLGTLWVEPARVNVRVARGEVSLSGRLDTRLDAELLPRLVARVPGVVSVSADLGWDAVEEA
jgi:CBS domain-containing protein